jgi:hypothetical protein
MILWVCEEFIDLNFLGLLLLKDDFLIFYFAIKNGIFNL